jgi:LytS/YehU family sensor histidine kinase
MNWKLIFTLSLFGVAMAIADVFGLTKNIKPYLWFLIFIFYAVWIVRHVDGKYFLYGFLVSVINGVWISIIHAAFFSTYIANNPEQMDAYAKFPQSIGPRLMMLIVGPIIGAITGLIAGLFAFIASKLLKKNPAL